MTRSLCLRVLILVPVILLTRFVTGEILARYKSKSDFTADSVKKTVVNGPLPAFRGKGAIASYFYKKFDVAVDGRQVRITASVDARSQSRSTNHLWRINVTDELGVTQVDRPYVEQMFSMHESGSMTPTFSELITLPPGKHQIILSFYGLPKGYDLNELNDRTKAQGASLINLIKEVTIE